MPALDARPARARANAGLPAISVSAPQGKFLHLLARIAGARRILEIGTLARLQHDLAGARAAGRRAPGLARIRSEARRGGAREHRPCRTVGDTVDIRVGRAIDSLPALERGEPFDFVFIDADKPSTPDYFRWAMKLTRKGGVIVVDNVVRKGEVDRRVRQGRRRRGDADVSCAGSPRNPRASGTVIQTVGTKGYDGFALVVV